MRAAVLIVVVLLLGGCVRSGGGSNDSLLPTPPVSPRAQVTAQPPATDAVPAPVLTPSLSPSPTAFSDSYIVPCDGSPTGAQVIAVVRRQPDLLPSGATITVRSGPMCTGVWQYTVLTAGDHEPLQVVTKGVPPSITFVTAGTDVCTVDVRANAPVALLDLASC